MLDFFSHSVVEAESKRKKKQHSHQDRATNVPMFTSRLSVQSCLPQCSYFFIQIKKTNSVLSLNGFFISYLFCFNVFTLIYC